MATGRTIRIEAFSRVEGEGGLRLKIQGGRLEEVRLEIFEPPRLFEALLRGRALEEAPDITARICGICPVAYQMSAVHALEAALGISVSPEVRRLRRLLYCGEWIESHCLHIHLLHAADFLGLESGLAMIKDYREEFQRGLRLKKHGNQLLEVLGGRPIHPINVAVGGFYRLPRRDELTALIPEFEWGLEAASQVVHWVSGFEFPDFDGDYDFVSLVHPAEYPFNEGRIAVGFDSMIDVTAFEQEFHELQVPHSTALQARRVATGRSYLTGPLARLNLNRERLSPTAKRLADEIGLEFPCTNPFKSIIARALEVVHAYEESLAILRDYRPVGPSKTTYTARDGEGCAATEAPRGLLYHRYTIGSDGLLKQAKIVPPTSQNQAQIEHDLSRYLAASLDATDEELAHRSEALVRSYDPCISCSTHFLRVTVDRS
ncbi:MAG TPA: Ni/Fe hydrogenase subunit alpha [Pirellulales bacterium]|nr:Ni/Fe hydrogenase subunit alpha [Pirellulales bacterium]